MSTSTAGVRGAAPKVYRERLDKRRLLKLLDDLEPDREVRAKCYRILQKNEDNRIHAPSKYLRFQRDQRPNMGRLERMRGLERKAESLCNELKALEADERGFVVRDVAYMRIDPAQRGHLFAEGHSCQNMPPELRSCILGAFAHDIDMVNSGVSIICNLVVQLDIAQKMPTVLSYRAHREEWVDWIAQQQGVSQAQAKKLPITILGGGSFDGWFWSLPKQNSYIEKMPNPQIRQWAESLQLEISLLRSQLMQHPRFSWTSIERKALQGVRERKNRSDESIENSLFGRVVQSCQDEILDIVESCFARDGWQAYGRVFDGLIVGHTCARTNNSATNSPATLEHKQMQAVLAGAEEACRTAGWDIELAEKPMHGTQDQPMRTLAEGRASLDAAFRAGVWGSVVYSSY